MYYYQYYDFGIFILEKEQKYSKLFYSAFIKFNKGCFKLIYNFINMPTLDASNLFYLMFFSDLFKTVYVWTTLLFIIVWIVTFFLDIFVSKLITKNS